MMAVFMLYFDPQVRNSYKEKFLIYFLIQVSRILLLMQSDSEMQGRIVIYPHCTVSLVHSFINYTAVASVVDYAERANSQEPAGAQEITIKTFPDTTIKTAPAFKSIIFESVEKLLPCWGGIATFLQPLQLQPQLGPQTWLQPQVEQVIGQDVALTDETVNDITKRTASKIPTVFYCLFPHLCYSPNFA